MDIIIVVDINIVNNNSSAGVTGVGQLILPSSLTPAGKYCYGAHLRQLEACKPECRGVPQRLLPVITPLEWGTTATPRSRFSAYIVGGLRDGFNYASHGCVSAKCNMLSATQYLEVIDAYLEEECTQGRIIGPVDTQEAEGVHISHFGVIPKLLAISVYIKASKTDPFRKGVQIFLGQTNDHVSSCSDGSQPRPRFPSGE